MGNAKCTTGLNSLLRGALALLLCAALPFCPGCGADGPQLVPAGGTVTYQSEPIEGATVLFMSEGGPPATGQTDAEGHFTFNTRGAPGAFVGPGRVSITAIEQTRKLTADEINTISPEELAKIRKSVIPQK